MRDAKTFRQHGPHLGSVSVRGHTAAEDQIRQPVGSDSRGQDAGGGQSVGTGESPVREQQGIINAQGQDPAEHL